MSSKKSKPVDKVAVAVHTARSDLKDGQTETTKRTRRIHLYKEGANGAVEVTGSVDHETLVAEQVKRTAVEQAGLNRPAVLECSGGCGQPDDTARRTRIRLV